MEDQAHADGSRRATRAIPRAKIWSRTGLHSDMFMAALKGALPPAIALAAYQAPAWADLFTTRGYFVAVVALLSMAMQPRAKFFQTIFALVVFICFAAAVNLLMIFCVIMARDPLHDRGLQMGSSRRVEATPYDSSANAVAATWLFVVVFVSNYLKAKRPQLAVPALQFNIYSITASIYAPSFAQMSAGLRFSRQLLLTFLTAYAIASAVNILIWPNSSRGEVRRQSNDLISGLKDCLRSYRAYTVSIVDGRNKGAGDDDPAELVRKFRDQTRQTSELFGKINLQLDFARKEIAVGKLTPEHLHDLYVRMREVLQPIMGLATFLRIVVEMQGDDGDPKATSSSPMLEAIRQMTADEWRNIILIYQDSHAQLQELLCQGLDHIAVQLRLESRRKNKPRDVEDNASPRPGDSGFAHYLEQHLAEHQSKHCQLTQEWSDQHVGDHDQTRQQLNLTLYLNFLLYNTGRAVLRQVRFADGLVADGTMSRNKLIFPGCRSIGKLMMGAFTDPNQDESMGMSANQGSNIWVGDMSKHDKDPEHLPPANVYEKATDCFRRVPRLLSSPHAGFALRSAVATLSIALVGFLGQTRDFFLEQRGIWAVSMTAIAMMPQFGASIPAFVMRILGTAAAAGISIAINYIADHNRAGIIVLYYVQAVFWILLAARFPSFDLGAIVGGVSVIVIAGYQLQVDTIGTAAATATGQAYHPIYFIALYRLAAISAGLAVAFFWSVFPFPVSSRGSLRQDTASTLYILANYHSCVHATLDVYPRFGPAIAGFSDDHPVKRLEEARQEVFGKSILMLGRLRDHLRSSRYEPRIGGRFPRDVYEAIIESLSHVFTYLTLMTYSSKTFVHDADYRDAGSDGEDDCNWAKEFCESTANVPLTSQRLTSTLVLLAAAVHNGQPLPPYLTCSHRPDLDEKSAHVAADEMDVRRFMHPCYTAFTINKVTASLIDDEVARLMQLIKELVGEIDFSFHIMRTSEGSMSTLVDRYSYGRDDASSGTMETVKVKGS